MIDKKILMEFCKDTGNPNAKLPYSIGDYTYATDGFIFVKVSRIAEFTENPKAPDTEKIEYGEIKAWYPVKNIKPPKAIDCEVCEGEGKNFTCPECSGCGTVWLSNAWSEYPGIKCNLCNGTGKIDFCEECNGTGKV